MAKWYHYTDDRPLSVFQKKYLIGLAVLLLAAATAGYALFNRHNVHSAKPAVTEAQQNQKDKPTASGTVSGRYLLNGTVTWARAVEQQAYGDYNQPFSQLDTFHRDQYDGWSTDFECPITNNTVPYQTQISDLIFNCRPEFLGPASKYFNIFDLANNHTDNQGGETGLDETRKHLDEVGAQYFGTFDSSDAKNICEVLALPVHIKNGDATEPAQLPVAFCGWHYFYRKPQLNELAAMDEYAKVMPVFAFAEMGLEYHAAADATQEEIAHQIIDRGPEFLIANNPHWVQNTEVYKEKLIVYSLGNFIFDQLDTETNRSASIDLTFTVDNDENTARWLALGPSCKAFHDDCLTKAKEQGLQKVKLTIQYGVVAGQNGHKAITHRANDAIRTGVLQRTNWNTTCSQLSAPYSCSDKKDL